MADVPRRHRYVHGGFEDSHTRFSVYLPPEDLYRGRFFTSWRADSVVTRSSLTAGGFMDPAAIFDLAFDELGGYLVESNQVTSTTKASARGRGRVVRRQRRVGGMRGRSPPRCTAKHLTRLRVGRSGGGVRTIACIENAPDVFDGASPNICGSAGIQQQWSAVGYWWLHCRHRREAIMDAVAPGGSGIRSPP